MAERMLKFTTVERTTPAKRAAAARAGDFHEIYADFIGDREQGSRPAVTVDCVVFGLDAWSPEPVMPHGAFGAMGGLVTTGKDYAKWIGYLLSAWPAKDSEPQNAKTIRAMQYGGGMLHSRRRPGKEGDNCRLSAIYGAGLVQANDCVLGNVLFHGGGFPGYGSHMLLRAAGWPSFVGPRRM